MQFSSFPEDERVWRLDWVGDVHGRTGQRRTPTVDVQFTPLMWQGQRWRDDVRAYDRSETLIKSVSINLWPVLRPGTFWKNGVSVLDEAGEIAEITVDVRNDTVRLSRAFDRLDGGRVLIPPFEHNLRSCMASSMVARFDIAGEGGIGELDIPCAELFRAYYGQSSRLAYHLLTGAFVGDQYNQIYDAGKSWIKGNECCVHLGYRIRNSDAMVVSRLAFDPVANQNAKRIVVDTIAASAAGKSYSLACLLHRLRR